MAKILLWVVVGAVVVFGGYSFIKSDKMDDSAVVEKGDKQESDQPVGKKMAFSQFIKQGGAYRCEVEQAISDMENSTTVYISGDKIRGESSTIAEGKTMQTSFILRDGYSYMWSSNMPGTGFKVKVANATNTETSGTYAWNAEQIGDYDCEVWAASEAQFALPVGITFQSIGASS